MRIIDNRYNNKHPIELQFHRYADNNNIAITSMVLGEEFPEPWATYTVNMDVKLPDDRIAIKTWSEGEGADLVLLAAGIIEGEPVDFLDSGFVFAPVYMLTEQAKKELP